MCERPGHIGDVSRNFADLLRHGEHELRTEAVGRERDRRFLLGRGLLLTGRIRDRA
ncbi:hypothetical protein ACVWW4_007587 [Bradyrhizobium sp. LB7.1]